MYFGFAGTGDLGLLDLGCRLAYIIGVALVCEIDQAYKTCGESELDRVNMPHRLGADARHDRAAAKHRQRIEAMLIPYVQQPSTRFERNVCCRKDRVGRELRQRHYGEQESELGVSTVLQDQAWGTE